MLSYLSGFVVWWYAVNARELLFRLVKTQVFIFQITRVSDMASNLGTPMFQDYTLTGKIFGFVLRFSWVAVGGLIGLLFAIPLLLVWIIYILLPVVTLTQVLLAAYFLIT